MLPEELDGPEDFYQEENSLGISEDDYMMMWFTEEQHNIYENMPLKEFSVWIRTDQYQRVWQYQNLKTLRHMYDFSERYDYIDKQKVIFDEIIRTEKYLNKNESV